MAKGNYEYELQFTQSKNDAVRCAKDKMKVRWSCYCTGVIFILGAAVGKRSGERHRRRHHPEFFEMRNQEYQRTRFDAVLGDIGRTISAYEALQQEEERARRFVARQHSLETEAPGVHLISILSHGAIGDGDHDDGPALVDALTEARLHRQKNKSARIVVHLPGAGYRYYIGAPLLVSDISNVHIRIDGIMLAPDGFNQYPQPARQKGVLSPEQERMQFAFLTLAGVCNLTLSGTGEIDGRGKPWWRIRKQNPRVKAPVLLLIRDSQDITIRHLSLYHSPFYHLVILRSRDVLIDRLGITSPSSSVNTDGIDVLASSNVHIQDCWISTGDDNLAIKEGASHVSVQGGTFFRGHGLSIGSLGEGGTTASVKHVFLSNVTFVRTANAARIKTWQGGHGAVFNITFKNLYVAGVNYPIVIDQFYCPQSQHPESCKNSSHAVRVSDIRILNLAGWHTSGVAASLHCSQAKPCKVALAGLDLRPAPGCSNVVRCLNVKTTPPPIDYYPASLSLQAPCQHGDEMHGYRLDLDRKQRRRLARNFSCIHPP